MDVFYSYTYGTCGWMMLQAAPLLVSPTMIVALLSPEVREASVLEVYFSRSLGMSLITLGVMCILLTGSVPLSSRLEAGVTTSQGDPKSPYAVPTLTLTTVYHSAVAFYCYTQWTEAGSASFALGVLGSGLLAVVGAWCILFASSNGRISRKTGADKRTSGFPFKNSESDRKKGKGL